MTAAASTILLITSSRVARADFDGALRSATSAVRVAGTSPAEAVRAAIALGEKPSRQTWVLSSEAWTQKVPLSPAQVAGLTPEQLGRALAFEVEPFSGIPASESAIGYRDEGGGAFSVVGVTRADRDSIERAISQSGGKLTGIAHPGVVPQDEDAMAAWWTEWPARLGGRALAMVTPPAPAPPASRFMVAGAVLAAAALVLIFAIFKFQAYERRQLESRSAEFAAAGRDLGAATKRNEDLRKELADLEKLENQHSQVHARRNALGALMNALAATRPDDVLIRALDAEGPSILIVSGFSLDAEVVDGLSIMLTKALKESGWLARTRSKKGQKNLPNGGPWEFKLALIHQEIGRANAPPQTDPE